MSSKLYLILLLILLSLAITSCYNEGVTPISEPVTTNTLSPSVTKLQHTITPSPTIFMLSETPLTPLAALVNGEAILLGDYEAEMLRYQASSGTSLATYNEEKVLEDMIDQLLLAQGAKEDGFIVDEDLIQDRINNLGLSTEELEAWKTVNGYSDESFKRALQWAIASAWMRDQITARAPDTAEQVHARQILLYNLSVAETVYTQLEAGTDFGTLAEEYEPISKGELGWFPRGYLTVTELDDHVFSIKPGEYSLIIKSPLGFHIVQVIDRDPNYPLSAEARRVLQVQMLIEWLESRRKQSNIEILVP